MVKNCNNCFYAVKNLALHRDKNFDVWHCNNYDEIVSNNDTCVLFKPRKVPYVFNNRNYSKNSKKDKLNFPNKQLRLDI